MMSSGIILPFISRGWNDHPRTGNPVLILRDFHGFCSHCPKKYAEDLGPKIYGTFLRKAHAVHVDSSGSWGRRTLRPSALPNMMNERTRGDVAGKPSLSKTSNAVNHHPPLVNHQPFLRWIIGWFSKRNHTFHWLVVWTPLKNISQLGPNWDDYSQNMGN